MFFITPFVTFRVFRTGVTELERSLLDEYQVFTWCGCSRPYRPICLSDLHFRYDQLTSTYVKVSAVVLLADLHFAVCVRRSSPTV